MEWVQFINNHLLIIENKRNLEDYLYIEAIVKDPLELINILDGSNYYISEISWWHRVHIGQTSMIGGGGPRDPRYPQDYYFSETFLAKEFSVDTPTYEYVEYINSVNSQYPMLDLYPGFDVVRKPAVSDAREIF